MTTRTSLRLKIGIGLAAVAVAAWGSGASAVRAQSLARQGAQAQRGADRASPKYETWLSGQVRHRLLMLPWYGIFDNLEYQIRGHEVILLGQVVRPVTKSDAAGTVKGIEGVTRVVNRIEVLPPSPFDDQIRRAEYRSLFLGGSPLFRYSLGVHPAIHIIVDRGRVSLEGEVDSRADRDMATIRAKLVPNVFSVTNDLRVART